MKRESKLLCVKDNINVRTFNSEVAERYDIYVAMVLSQINYWLQKYTEKNDSKHNKDGRFWVYNSFESWREQMPYMSISTIRRATKKLIDEGILLKGNYNKSPIDKTSWYTIDYDKLDDLFSENTSICSERADGYVLREQTNTKDYTYKDYNSKNNDSNIVNDSPKSFDILPFSKGKVSSLEDYIERVLPDYVRNVYAFEFNEHELKLIEYFITKFLKDRSFYLDDEYYPTQKELTKNLETWEILREHGLFTRKCFDDAIDQYFELKTNDRMYLSHILAPNMIMGMLTYSEESEQALDYLKENCYQFMCV